MIDLFNFGQQRLTNYGNHVEYAEYHPFSPLQPLFRSILYPEGIVPKTLWLPVHCKEPPVPKTPHS